ncbi:MAG: HEAT repeat domain-containing protein [Deltaproteobacteria bacterium]|nr:HEAT repeat domain-containing protein [Deltaproteobacteria bacterium]MBW2395472.1 HEAT repeat domain-containing protein [Deltaproteobacteria bacterium]
MQRTHSTSKRPSLHRQAALAALFCSILALPASGATRSAEVGLLRALETASLLVIGQIDEVTPLLHMGYAAHLSVERVLRPQSDASRLAGQSIEFVWEETSPRIRPRLSAGQRVVVALEPGPTASIWKQRIPDPARRAALRSLAAGGQGYLQGASAGMLGALEHYLALTQAARRGEAGATYLSQLAATAPPRLALDAVLRLKHEPKLIEALTPAAGEALIAAMLRSDADSTARMALQLVEEERPAVLLPLLEARIGSLGAKAPVPLLAARAALQDGLPADLEEQLMESGSEEQRKTAVRWATGPEAGERLRHAMLRDRSPAVREAALLRLARLEGSTAASDLLQGFEDREPSVQYAAARALASFGPEVLPDLRRAIDRGSPQGSKAAVVAITLMPGGEARHALEELARDHEDPAVRALARISLGQPLDEDH